MQEIQSLVSKNFLKSSFLYTLSGALPMASMVLLVPFYLLLPVKEFGALAIYTTFSGLVQVIVTYSFDTSVYIYYHDYKKDFTKLAIYVSSAFTFIFLAGIAAIVISIATGKFIFGYVYSADSLSFYPFGFLSVITAVFQALFKVHSSLNQSRQRPLIFFWSNVLSFSLIAVFTIIGLKLFPNTLIGPVGGRALAAIISGVWAFVRIIREFGFHFDLAMLRLSFPYNNTSFFYNIQQWFIMSFDRTVIGIYLTLSDVGTYDLAFKCVLFVQFITDGLYGSIQPKVLGMVAEQETKGSTVLINRYYNGLMSVTMLLVCLLILFAPLTFESGLIPKKYEGYKIAMQYIPLIGVIYFVRALRYYFVLPVGALKYVKPLPYIYTVVSVVKIGLMVLFIRPFGIYAVVGSDFVSRILEIVILYFALRPKFNFNFNVFKLIIAPVFLGGLIISMEFAGFFNQHLRHGGYLVCCLLMLVWIYRNELPLLKPNFSK